MVCKFRKERYYSILFLKEGNKSLSVVARFRFLFLFFVLFCDCHHITLPNLKQGLKHQKLDRTTAQTRSKIKAFDKIFKPSPTLALSGIESLPLVNGFMFFGSEIIIKKKNTPRPKNKPVF